MLFLGVGVGEPCERWLPSLLELGGGGRECGPLPRTEGLQKATCLPHLLITVCKIRFLGLLCAGHLGLISQAAQVVGTIFVKPVAA